MVDVPQQRQAGRVPQPGAAMQEGDRTHPVGMLVEDEQVEWLREAPHQR